MKNRRRFARIPVTRTGIALLSLFALTLLVACNQSPSPAAAPMASTPKAAPTKEVYVVFEGPWAVVPDPRDANSVLVLAPKTKIHRDLFVAASNESMLVAGTYDLSVPAHGAATSASLDPSFAQVNIDAKSLQRALDDKSNRYVVRLPKPEAYVAARRYRTRLGPSYPPDASTEQNYASSVSFLYTVNSLNGFSLAGASDAGTFNPLLFQLDTPTIRFAIEPVQADDPKDLCNMHSREAFRDTTKFLGLALFLDFPNDPPGCHDKDPQKVRSTKAEAGAGVPRYPLAAMYLYLFFHGSAVDCHPPILFLNPTTS